MLIVCVDSGAEMRDDAAHGLIAKPVSTSEAVRSQAMKSRPNSCAGPAVHSSHLQNRSGQAGRQFSGGGSRKLSDARTSVR
jgi:hypothetical protein